MNAPYWKNTLPPDAPNLGHNQMMDLSGKHIPDNRELFAFLAGEQMGIPHGHGDVLMAHELLQFHECDLAGLCQPGCERMPHGMQCDHIQTVAVFWLQTEFSDGGLKHAEF